MAEMVRKQIYIHRRQQALLRRLARSRGVSEAEIVRQAIEREAMAQPRSGNTYDPSAWEAVLAFVTTRNQMAEDNAPYHWRREDAYDLREAALGAS